MNIRTFIPDYAYLPSMRQNDPYELLGIAMEHDGKELYVHVKDDPYSVAGALEAIAGAIRRAYP